MATNQSKLSFSFHPKILDTFRNYSRQDFTSDRAAGLTVGIIALSLAMALGIASGTTGSTCFLHAGQKSR